MNKTLRYALAGLLLLHSLHASAEVLYGRVVSVADGDSITILDAHNLQHKIRLAGIDAPEKAQPYGEVSRESLAEMVAGKDVVVETTKKDRYGRAVGKVLVDGQDANLMQLERGLAWFYREYQNELSPDERIAYEAAELSAQSLGNGLWHDFEPIAPWTWRIKGRLKNSE
jgi:endonuclease YncB( thermonuclease family)